MKRVPAASRRFRWGVGSMGGIVIVLAVALWATASSAEDPQSEDWDKGGHWTGTHTVRRSTDDAWHTQLWAGVEFQGDTDLDGNFGEFDTWMVAFGASTARNFGEHAKLALQGDFRTIGYDFDLNNDPDPWDDIYVFRLNPVITYEFNPTWSVLGGPVGEFSGEGGADFGDSLRGGGMAAVVYTTGDKRFFLAVGVVALTEIEEDLRIQPLVLLNWNVTGAASLGLKGDTSRGGELRLDYTWSDLPVIEALTAGIGAGFRHERFRLNDDSPTVRKDGVGEESATIVKATVALKLTDFFTLEGYGGVTVDGEFRLEDDDGNKIRQRDYDDAGFGGVTLRFAF